jgi:hypothetical protein
VRVIIEVTDVVFLVAFLLVLVLIMSVIEPVYIYGRQIYKKIFFTLPPKKLDSVASVHQRNIPTERPPLGSEVSANFRD